MFKRLLNFIKGLGKKDQAAPPEEASARKKKSPGKKTAGAKKAKPRDKDGDASSEAPRVKKASKVRAKTAGDKAEAQPRRVKRKPAVQKADAGSGTPGTGKDKPAPGKRKPAPDGARTAPPSKESLDAAPKKKKRPAEKKLVDKAFGDVPISVSRDEAAALKKKKAAQAAKRKALASKAVPEELDVKIVKGAKKKKKPKIPDAVPEDMDIKVAKGAKKKKKKAAPKVDIGSTGDSEFAVSFKGSADQHSERKSYRVSGRGMGVRLRGVEDPCPVLDVSVTGIGFKLKKPKLKRGNVIAFEILDTKGQSLGKVRAEVMRHFEGEVGCCFKNLDSRVEDSLYRIVLEAQKKPEGKGKSISLNLDL